MFEILALIFLFILAFTALIYILNFNKKLDGTMFAKIEEELETRKARKNDNSL